MKIKNKFELSLPQAIVLSVAIAAFAAVYLLVDEDQRSQFNEWIAIGWAALATVLGPLLRRYVEDPPESDSKPPKSGTGTGVAGGAVTAILAIVLPISGACGGGVQTTLNGAAGTLVELSSQAGHFYEVRDVSCREEFPPLDESHPAEERAARRDQYDECMTPVEVARTTRATLDRALRAGQSAYNLRGKDGFKEHAPCILNIAQQLVAALTEIEDRVPQELNDLIELAAYYTTAGQECTREYS